MKKIISILSMLLIFSLANAEEKNIIVESEISEATVFLSGAQITRKAKKFLTPGTYFLVFDGLTVNIDQNSIQVDGKGDFTILSVSPQRNYLQNIKESSKIEKLQDSLESMNIDLQYQIGMRAVYTEEKNMILTNKKIEVGRETGFAIEDLEEMAEFFRNRLKDLMNKQAEITAEEKELRLKISRISNELNQLKRGNTHSSEIVVEVAVNKNTPASFKLKYYVPQAGWTPLYDLRASGPTEKIKLGYNAQVYQSTGIDWENVKLELSTSNPRARTDRPEMNPWALRFIGTANPQALYQSNRGFDLKAKSLSQDAEVAEAGSPAQFTTVNESQLNVNFKIAIPYNIPSDNKRHTVNVQNIDLDAEYYYYAAPKLSTKSFLVASISGWEKHKLLSGKASIYFQGVYLGSTFIDANNTDAKLDISLGEDKQVVITRNRIEDYCDSKMIGTNKKENIGIEISAKNTKSTKIKLVIKDQIPISSNREIEVELEEQGGAELNEQTGELTWTYELAPAQSEAMQFKYVVKFPKDKRINL